jgi:hypothetical protein
MGTLVCNQTVTSNPGHREHKIQIAVRRRLQDKKDGQRIVAAKKYLLENRSCGTNIPKLNELAKI